jgi:hypothetical protein
VGVEITVILQIDRVYAALRTPAPLQSLLNITALGAVGIENNTEQNLKDLEEMLGSARSLTGDTEKS